MKLHNRFFLFKNKYIRPYIDVVKLATDILFFIVSLLSIIIIVYKYGVGLSYENEIFITDSIKTLRDLFFVLIPLRFIFMFLIKGYQIKPFSQLLYIFFMFIIVPLIFSPSQNNITVNIFHIFSHEIYVMTIISMLSFIEISRVIISSLGKKTTPSIIIISSFFFIIVMGAGLLLLPRSTTSHLSVIDAIFVSTSAVCVTGLTPVEISSLFTPLGQFFIIILIQIGGLGFMTFTSFFTLFLIGGSSLNNQVVISDMISSGSLSSLFGTLKRIFAFTIIIEFIGAVFIWLSIRGTLNMPLEKELAFSAFHSISAFCNAGFSTLPLNLGNSLVILNNGLLITISFLIIFGGIGFPILSNFMTIFAFHFKRFVKHVFHRSMRIRKVNHLYNLNTKIVISLTAILLVGGTLSIAILEWNNSFAEMTFAQKISQSFFNAVSPRTAGFSSVDMTGFSIQTIMIIIVLMWIGGGSQSTAGGIKVNALGVALVNLYSKINGKERENIFRRELSSDTVSRSSATILISILVIFLATFTLSIIEGEIPLKNIVFEVVSAVGTVGLSLNTTPILSDGGKIIIITLMFVGRIGLLTMAIGLFKPQQNKRYIYPSDNVIIS